MRRFFLGLAAAAGLLVSGSMAHRAEAITVVAPAGLQDAMEELATIEPVHCRPGWRHHRPTQWRRANGCLRRGVVVVPGRWHLRGHSWRGGYRWHNRRWR